MSSRRGDADHDSDAYESSHENIPESWDQVGEEDDDAEYTVDVANESEDEDNDEYMDAEGGELELELLMEPPSGPAAANDDDAGEWTETSTDTDNRPVIRIGGTAFSGFLSTHHLLSVLRSNGLGYLLDDPDAHNVRAARRRRSEANPARFPKVPNDKGRELMESGRFGAFDLRDPNRKRLARRILERELGLGNRTTRRANQALMAQQMIPSSKPEMVIHYNDPVCCGQFSDDGNFFYTCVKDFRVRMYDTSNPYSWRHYKTHTYPFGQWTLTDADLSPDNRWLAYTSLQSNVCFAPTDPNDTGDPYALDLSDAPSGAAWQRRRGFAIFSVRFSGDGRKLVAGTGAHSIVVYDIERRQPIHRVHGHDDDVNAVCFADKLSPHILYSGSDDCTIKVWDTRSMGDEREAGAFVGHIEGLTYIDSKGDGRYILSNGKDQSLKLWDLRMAMSTSRFEELDPMSVTRRRGSTFDYRWDRYDNIDWFEHEHDNSLVTFRGHKVMRTLIRCHFSPPGSTDSRYVYSGSQDGFIYIWNLDATLAAKINVTTATDAVQPPGRLDRRHWETLVRDVGWHPNAPLLVASSWCGSGYEGGTATVHSYNDNETDEAEPAMGRLLDEKLRPDPYVEAHHAHYL